MDGSVKSEGAALLPPEEVGYIADKTVKAERRLGTSPYDVDAWNVLVRDAQTKNIADARKIYERVVVQFPNCGRYWKMYIEHEVGF
ncbi:DgyrCDS14091 [Dimorphilus gyrociliatus]|uniref:DgyrCDS14091 n=1 Tax=Dimorphilus gyrociliatus TaxID=2664684 RepID=A0A7I8WCJ7_9ANNE|nr:DgyrCDS14091 [Dimorphilus gyrociliatus]